MPIYFKEKDRAELDNKCEDLYNVLKEAGVRVKLDQRANYTPAWKYNHYEQKGVPLRLELGPRDLQGEQVLFSGRHVRLVVGHLIFFALSLFLSLSLSK